MQQIILHLKSKTFWAFFSPLDEQQPSAAERAAIFKPNSKVHNILPWKRTTES